MIKNSIRIVAPKSRRTMFVHATRNYLNFCRGWKLVLINSNFRHTGVLRVRASSSTNLINWIWRYILRIPREKMKNRHRVDDMPRDFAFWSSPIIESTREFSNRSTANLPVQFLVLEQFYIYIVKT